MRVIALFIAVLATLAPFTAAAVEEECPVPAPNPLWYGPYDYRTDKDKLLIVEMAHFTPDVENLRHQLAGYFGADLDYTLRAFPNHHRSLVAMVNLVLKEHKLQPKGARWSIECYFDRAARFAPDDAVPPMIYGVFLNKVGKKKEAIEAFKASERLDPNNVNLQYDLGLVYFDLKQFDLALEYAQKAYRGGATLPGLKKNLLDAGRWKEPPPAPMESAAQSNEVVSEPGK